MLLNRGGCTYVTKAKNVEALGGKAVVVAQSLQGTYSTCSPPDSDCSRDEAAMEYDCSRGMAYLTAPAAEPPWSEDNSIAACFSNARWCDENVFVGVSVCLCVCVCCVVLFCPLKYVPCLY